MKRTQPAHLRRGQQAEQQACDYLRSRGLRLLERNFRSPSGEIDLVMDAHGTVVFVEVRYRNNDRFGGPAETIDHRKRKKLHATAQYYLQSHRSLANRPCRFDVVAILPGDGETGLQWIPDAFRSA